jgi:putative FmdB family regulatory protein
VPSYFYECQRCAKVFTVARKLDEYDQPATHEDCGNSTTKRVMFDPFSVVKNGGDRRPSARQSQRIESTDPRPLTARMLNCKAIDCDTGIKISGSARIEMDGTELRGNRVSIDMSEQSELRARRTVIE